MYNESMLCPQCSHSMTSIEVPTTDNQKTEIDECYFCGGHFLTSLIANFITQESAKNIDSILPQQPTVSSTYSTLLQCPICEKQMTSVRDESTPASVIIYACPDNHGNFFPKDHLYLFKIAQKAKITYHQVWGVPVASIFAILLPVTLIFTGITVLPIALEQIKQNQENRISASSQIGTPVIVTVNQNVAIISFSTYTPTTTKILLISPAGNETIDVSPKAQLSHTITLNQLTPATTYQYKIITPNLQSETYNFTTPNQ